LYLKHFFIELLHNHQSFLPRKALNEEKLAIFTLFRQDGRLKNQKRRGGMFHLVYLDNSFLFILTLFAIKFDLKLKGVGKTAKVIFLGPFLGVELDIC
jgi:hypothetical protein